MLPAGYVARGFAWDLTVVDSERKGHLLDRALYAHRSLDEDRLARNRKFPMGRGRVKLEGNSLDCWKRENGQ